METRSLIRIEYVCTHCRVDRSFVRSLGELGHVDLIIEEEEEYIAEEQLKSLESLIAFHTELAINIEGIDAIAHLLNKIGHLQQELRVAKNKLQVFTEK